MLLIYDKICTPTHLDKAEQFTGWRVALDDEPTRLYVQISPDQDKPDWVRFGDLFEETYSDVFDNVADTYIRHLIDKHNTFKIIRQNKREQHESEKRNP